MKADTEGVGTFDPGRSNVWRFTGSDERTSGVDSTVKNNSEALGNRDSEDNSESHSFLFPEPSFNSSCSGRRFIGLDPAIMDKSLVVGMRDQTQT